jgi:hypothetical protein
VNLSIGNVFAQEMCPDVRFWVEAIAPSRRAFSGWPGA